MTYSYSFLQKRFYTNPFSGFSFFFLVFSLIHATTKSNRPGEQLRDIPEDTSRSYLWIDSGL